MSAARTDMAVYLTTLVTALLLLLLVFLGAVMGLGRPEIDERNVQLQDGRVIVCLQPRGIFSRSISCDWKR